jgi:hypothetical protein
MTGEQAIGRIWARLIWEGRKTADDVPEKHWESAKLGAWDLFGMTLTRSAKYKKEHGSTTTEEPKENGSTAVEEPEDNTEEETAEGE